MAGRFVSVDIAEARAEVALSEMSIGFGSLLGRIYRRQEVVSGDIIVEQKRRCQMKAAMSLRSGPGGDRDGCSH